LALGEIFADIWDTRIEQAIVPHSEYQKDPIGWTRDVLGIPEHTIRWSMNEGYDSHTWDGDVDPLVKIAEALADWEDVGAESGTGTGKSFWIACLILWFLACWENSRVFTFAPKEDQLKKYIWMEIGKLWPKFIIHFPSAVRLDLSIRMRGGQDESWGANGVAVGVGANEEVSSKAAGMHAEHQLLVYEETQGINPAVMKAGEHTSVAPHNLRVAIGNPGHQHDSLHRFCIQHRVVHVTMSALDHPNVVTGNPSLVPGAVSQESIDDRRLEDGEDSPEYQRKVRGRSPEQATNALIRMEWLRSSAERYAVRKKEGTLPTGPRAKGVDVANSLNGDKAAIADFVGNTLPRSNVRQFQCPDSNLLGSQVFREMKDEGVPQEHVGVDPVGVGAGTVNELARLGKIVRRLGGANKPVLHAEKGPDGLSYDWAPDANEFGNLRCQMHWQLRRDLQHGDLDIEWNQELAEELTSIEYEPRNGKTWIESKDDIKDRTGKSPNMAEAVIYGNWVRPRARKMDSPGPKRPSSPNSAPVWDYDRKKLVRWNDPGPGENVTPRRYAMPHIHRPRRPT
jgi:phage terminase large subunit